MQHIFSRNRKSYGYIAKTGHFIHNRQLLRLRPAVPYGTGDIISVTLNMKQYTLSFAKNDVDLVPKFENVLNGAYRLTVALGCETDSVTIL